MKMVPTVLVLMATYNGERYVGEQIESILAQKDVEVYLSITDDGSTDGTLDILEFYSASYSNISIHKNPCNKGVANNFMDMLRDASLMSFDYYALSDQDDYWMPEKLIKAIEKIANSGVGPRLYYSDVCNTDKSLQGEHREYAPFAPYSSSLKLLLTINWALGCTMVMNAEFLDRVNAYRPPAMHRIHDVWLHLIALSCDWVVSDLSNSYIKRRITGSNVVGDMRLGHMGFNRFKEAISLLFSKSTRFSQKMTQYLLDGYSSNMSLETRTLLERFLVESRSLRGRISLAFDRGFRGPHGLENKMFVIKMILGRY